MKKRKCVFVTLVVISVNLLILLYINFCKPYIVVGMWLDMWQEILVDRYENSESYFDDLRCYYYNLEYQKLLPQSLVENEIVELDGTNYIIGFKDDYIVLSEKENDGVDGISDAARKKMLYCNTLKVYLNNDTMEPEQIWINISTNIPSWIEPINAEYYLVWAKESEERIAGSFFGEIALNNGWRFLSRSVF